MKKLKDFILESINTFNDNSTDEFIYEGFLDKLKDAIDNVVDNPKKYFGEVEKNLQKLKETTEFRYKKKNDPEKIAEELDKLNNNKDLKTIYKHVKELLERDGEWDTLKCSLIYKSYGHNELYQYIKDNFDNCDDNKLIAIAQIMEVLADAIRNNEKPSNNNKSGGHKSTSSKKAAGYATASAVAIALKR